MSRSRATAKQAGSSFERLIADWFKGQGFPFADRRVKRGNLDTGDIGGVHIGPHQLAFEVKDYGGKLDLPAWMREAKVEALNAGAFIGAIIAKRRGTTKPQDQWVILTLEDFTKLIKLLP
ncbi:hypothetical protein [Arthrobacter sp. MDT1-65]